MHFLRKSYVTEETRDHMEKARWQETMEKRKKVKEENPTGGYGWFNFVKSANAPQEEGQEAQAGWNLRSFAPNWLTGGGDPDAPPSTFDNQKSGRRDSAMSYA